MRKKFKYYYFFLLKMCLAIGGGGGREAVREEVVPVRWDLKSKRKALPLQGSMGPEHHS